MDNSSVGAIIRKAETDYTKGTTHQSKYVNFQMYDTLQKISAYLNSKFVSGPADSQGRKKPFFNIVVAAANIWFRATDIDRSNIKIRANNAKSWLDSFAATVVLRQWMKKEAFGIFLNEWGRVLARYGSAVTKFVENSTGLHISVTPWDTLICDSIDFDNNPKIEVLDLTEAQLRERIVTHGWYETAVDGLCQALTDRADLDKRRKDNKADYIRIYELHGKLKRSLLVKEGETVTPEDEKTYVQQMHVISFVGTKTGRTMDYKDFTLYAGEEEHDPYFITHLIKEDGRSLAIGAVEYLFDAQWMQNHSAKAVKDTLDLASKLIFKTNDGSFVGQNVLTDMENGDIVVYGLGNDASEFSQLNNSKPDVAQWMNYSSQWKQLGNEITGISESMLGIAPKSGTAWRQTEAILQESYSLFELMTENKGLSLEQMFRERIIPWVRKTKLDNADEVSAILEDHEITRIDSMYIKSKSAREAKRKAIVEPLLRGEVPTMEGYQQAYQDAENQTREALATLGNQRFFKPSEMTDKMWAEQFKDMEWDLEVDVTGENYNAAEAMTTLNTALKLVVTPGFEQNKRAQLIVGRILELAGAMSPIEYNAIPAEPALPAPAPAPAPQPAEALA